MKKQLMYARIIAVVWVYMVALVIGFESIIVKPTSQLIDLLFAGYASSLGIFCLRNFTPGDKKSYYTTLAKFVLADMIFAFIASVISGYIITEIMAIAMTVFIYVRIPRTSKVDLLLVFSAISASASIIILSAGRDLWFVSLTAVFLTVEAALIFLLIDLLQRVDNKEKLEEEV